MWTGAGQRGGVGREDWGKKINKKEVSGVAAGSTSSPPSMHPSPSPSSPPEPQVTHQGPGGGVNSGQVGGCIRVSPRDTESSLSLSTCTPRSKV